MIYAILKDNEKKEIFIKEFGSEKALALARAANTICCLNALETFELADKVARDIVKDYRKSDSEWVYRGIDAKKIKTVYAVIIDDFKCEVSIKEFADIYTYSQCLIRYSYSSIGAYESKKRAVKEGKAFIERHKNADHDWHFSWERRKLHVTVFCQASYDGTIEVPADLSLDEAIEYAKEHIDEIPRGDLEYIDCSDEISEEHAYFEED